MIDLRGCNPTDSLKFKPDETPVRLDATTPGSDAWNRAKYEIREVVESKLIGVMPGDFVLFSRVEKDISVGAENPTVKG